MGREEDFTTEVDAHTDVESTEIETTDPIDEIGIEESSPESEAIEDAYQANLSFKVMGEEKQFDEFLHGVVTDAESESKLRELYEKAHGLDHVKSDRDQYKTQYSELESKYGHVEQNLKKVDGFLEAKDYDKFFESLKINEQDVLNHFIQKIQYQGMSESDRRVYDDRLSFQRQNQELQEKNRFYEEQQQNFVHQQFENEMTQALGSNEGIRSSYDSQYGEGAFRREVEMYGHYQYSTQGRDLTPTQAAEEVIKMRGLGNVAPIESSPNYQSVGPEQPAQAKQPETIPNLSGGQNASPVRRTPGSIDDLKKIYDEKFGN